MAFEELSSKDSRRSGCTHVNVVPGLDANLCRCSHCIKIADEGVFWVDVDQRYDSLKKVLKIPYLRQVYGLMDKPVDHDTETKAKAKSTARKNQQWAGEKMDKAAPKFKRDRQKTVPTATQQEFPAPS